MAILALPLVISFLKPHTSRLFLLRPGKPNPTHLCNPLGYCRRFTKTSVSAISTSAAPHHDSSTNPISVPQKASVLTFQQAIQRLQVSLFNQNSLHFTLHWYFLYICIHMCFCVCNYLILMLVILVFLIFSYSIDAIHFYVIGILGFGWMCHNAM